VEEQLEAAQPVEERDWFQSSFQRSEARCDMAINIDKEMIQRVIDYNSELLSEDDCDNLRWMHRLICEVYGVIGVESKSWHRDRSDERQDDDDEIAWVVGNIVAAIPMFYELRSFEYILAYDERESESFEKPVYSGPSWTTSFGEFTRKYVNAVKKYVESSEDLKAKLVAIRRINSLHLEFLSKTF
jgi:hypothetical protein